MRAPPRKAISAPLLSHLNLKMQRTSVETAPTASDCAHIASLCEDLLCVLPARNGIQCRIKTRFLQVKYVHIKKRNHYFQVAVYAALLPWSINKQSMLITAQLSHCAEVVSRLGAVSSLPVLF